MIAVLAGIAPALVILLLRTMHSDSSVVVSTLLIALSVLTVILFAGQVIRKRKAQRRKLSRTAIDQLEDILGPGAMERNHSEERRQ